MTGGDNMRKSLTFPATIIKIGNSAGIRIPAVYLKRLSLDVGADIDVTVTLTEDDGHE